ncbi:MAG: ABC transporter ATP-binding protein [Oscillospiraceae bacterium]|nr:ABC transporter ATP-binding protein [Oscillospiraceae bacterium]
MHDILLECRGLTKQFGHKTALAGVDLALGRGRITGLLGPNGSGKTTLMKLANGLLTPTSGSIAINGMAPCRETKAIVSYLPDASYLPNWMTVRDLVAMFTDFYPDFSADKAVEMLCTLDIHGAERLKSLSKGTKEKVQLVLAMSRRAQLYLLDEPIGGVDPASRDYILRTILQNYSPEATVLISTHLISDIEPVLDEAIFIRDGRIFSHRSVDDIRAREGKSVDEYFREVFRC